MRKIINWPITRENVKERYTPLTFNVDIPVETAVIIKKKKEEKKSKRTIKFNVFGKIEWKEWKKVKEWEKLSNARFNCQIPFHCCDKCGCGFGVIDYPDGKYATPDPKPFKLRLEGKTYELCNQCHKKYSRRKIKVKKNE